MIFTIKKLRNFEQVPKLLLYISALYTTGGKTTDKMFLDQYKQDDDRYCCKQ